MESDMYWKRVGGSVWETEREKGGPTVCARVCASERVCERMCVGVSTGGSEVKGERERKGWKSHPKQSKMYKVYEYYGNPNEWSNEKD